MRMGLALKCCLFFSLAALLFTSCKEDEDNLPTPCTEITWYEDADGDGLGNPLSSVSECDQPGGYVDNSNDPDDTVDNILTAVEREFEFTIDLNDLDNYANQFIPNYINKDNTNVNPITDAGATLGRVLFYDRALSANYTTACADCHQQAFAFSDLDQLSEGANGITGRHSMRLINARFSDESKFFWDERAASLEIQTTMPIQDHAEMGFSGENGDPDFDDLIERLEAIDYYQELFTFVYGDASISEVRIQSALAQFIRSIQSFDSRYDEGFAQTNNLGLPFPNFTQEENMGKQLFLAPADFDPTGIRISGGLGCQVCHRGPVFDIDPNSLNNGAIAVANTPGTTDITVTRAPSLRDLFNPNGLSNGPMMHSGNLGTIDQVLNHYNGISFNPMINNNLDPRLRPGGQGQQLQMTVEEREAVAAFLKTLTGVAVYADARWSDPF